MACLTMIKARSDITRKNESPLLWIPAFSASFSAIMVASRILLTPTVDPPMIGSGNVTGAVWFRNEGGKHMFKSLVTAIVIIGITSVGSGKPAVARTPEETLMNFATAMDKGDVKGMMAMIHYKDKKGVEAALTLIAKMRELDNALEKEYGKQEGGWESSGIDNLTVKNIQSDDFRINVDGDKAEAGMWGDFNDTPLLKVNGAWYIDMITDTPTGQAREQALEMMKMMSKVLKEAKSKIGKPGYTRDKIYGEFMGALMGAAMQQTVQVMKQPPPGNTDKEIRDVVNRFDKVLGNPTVAAIKPLVHEHYGKPFAESITEDYLKYLKSTGQTCRIKRIERIGPTMLDQVRVEVIVTISGPKSVIDKSGSLNFMKNEAAEWKFVGPTPDDLLFPKKPIPKIETSQFSKYITAYPNVTFSPIAILLFQAADGPVREVDSDARTGIKGTTTAPPNQVCEFYKQQMEGKWHDFKAKAWGNSYEISGWKLFPDGKKVGAFVDIKKTSKGTRIAIVLGILPRTPGDENYVDKPAAKKRASGSSSSHKPVTSPRSKSKSIAAQKTAPKTLKGTAQSKKIAPPRTLNAKVDFKRGKFIINNGDNFDWTQVKMTVNGEYVLRTARIATGDWFSPKASEFKNLKGAPYKSLAARLVSFRISASIPKGNLSFTKKW
ncbi:hypothetical protein ACFL1X_06030 [Candidatus Hydrogenedentota bacterium]